MDWDFVKKLFQIFYKIFLLSVLLIICLTALPKIIDYYRGEKIIVEGEFTILDKNTTHTSFLWMSDNTFTFTLKSDNEERYVVQVSDTIYHSYIINEKIKVTLETYFKDDTCNLLEVEGVVASE